MGTGRAGRLGTQSAEAAAARGVPSCVCGTMWSVTAGALDLSGTPVKAVAAVKSARLILVELGPEPPTIFFSELHFLDLQNHFSNIDAFSVERAARLASRARPGSPRCLVCNK
mgnify:CR=1 FL=1